MSENEFHVQMYKSVDKTNLYKFYPVTKSDDVQIDDIANSSLGDAKTVGDVLSLLKNMAFQDTVDKNTIGLSNVTNNKQVNAPSTSFSEGNVVVFGPDNSTIKDGGVTVKTSVPENAKFTDTTYGDASISEKGIVQLNDSTNSSSTTTAATSNAVKKAYDEANSRVKSITTGTTNGSINVDNVSVQVCGLKSSAFRDASDFASNSQGSKADTAMQTAGGTFTGPITLFNEPETDKQPATKKYVDEKISEISNIVSEGVVYKGTLGTDGKYTTLPEKSVSKGDMYKIISNGTYAGYTCKVGDMLISTNSGDVTATSANWDLVPSGNETETFVGYSTTNVNASTEMQSGNVTFGEASIKQLDRSISDDMTSDNVPTTDAILSYLASKGIGSGVESAVVGVKGNAETTYRTGKINLTPENIGAATTAQGNKADTAIQGVSIGTVTTGDAGTSASATVTKDSNNIAKINFVIPRGSNGVVGPTGATGATGPAGSTGNNGITYTPKMGTVLTGEAGSTASGTLSISGTNAIYNFTIPRGDKGDTGSIGPTGPAGTNGIQGKTGPTGATGLQGVEGKQGPTGASGKQGLTGPTGATGPTGNKGVQGPTGATGPQGNPGARGSMIFYGTAITGTSTESIVFSGSGISNAVVNDMYINTDTNCLYQCTYSGNASTAKWVYKTDLTGDPNKAFTISNTQPEKACVWFKTYEI